MTFTHKLTGAPKIACTVRCGGGRKPSQSGQHRPRGSGASRRPYLLALAAVQPFDTVTICLGTNDAYYSEGPSTFYTDMANLIGQIQATGADVILIAPFTPSLPGSGTANGQIAAATWLSYMQRLFNLADALDLPLLNLSEYGGPFTVALANGLMVPGDGVHCEPEGYACMAGGILGLLDP